MGGSPSEAYSNSRRLAYSARYDVDIVSDGSAFLRPRRSTLTYW